MMSTGCPSSAKSTGNVSDDSSGFCVQSHFPALISGASTFASSCGGGDSSSSSSSSCAFASAGSWRLAKNDGRTSGNSSGFADHNQTPAFALDGGASPSDDGAGGFCADASGGDAWFAGWCAAKYEGNTSGNSSGFAAHNQTPAFTLDGGASPSEDGAGGSCFGDDGWSNGWCAAKYDGNISGNSSGFAAHNQTPAFTLDGGTSPSDCGASGFCAEASGEDLWSAGWCSAKYDGNTSGNSPAFCDHSHMPALARDGCASGSGLPK
mmetsp:Transcript_101756/g.294479  ORF Transcript_101756/g.294479 Transcript_101756/m.294479 type:complete len:265 (+) Transcript_101756:2070-2864(+)